MNQTTSARERDKAWHIQNKIARNIGVFEYLTHQVYYHISVIDVPLAGKYKLFKL